MFIGSFSDMAILAMSKGFAGSGSGTSWHFEIVDVLPDAASADPSAMYLLIIQPEEEGGEVKYAEYIVVDGNWNPLGYLDISLDDYATKEQLNAITAIVSLESLGLDDYSGTTVEFINAIRSSTMAVGSMAIGGVSLSDLPGGLENCEIVVTRTNSQVTNLAISSNNRAPYQWFFNHWIGGHEDNNIWRTYIDECYTKDEVEALSQDILNVVEATNLDVAEIDAEVQEIQDDINDIQEELSCIDEDFEQRVWGINEIDGISDVSTMTELFIAIANTPNIPNYAIITGIISFGTLPSGISQGEITVQKVQNASIPVYNAELAASGSAPYRWHWNGNSWMPYTSKELTTISSTAPAINTIKDGYVYNLTRLVTRLTIIDISQSVNGDESIIYCTTGDTINFTYPEAIKSIGSAELQPNTQYVIKIQNSIMTISEVS